MVRHLAAELKRELAQQRVHAVHFQRETTTVALHFEDRALECELRGGRLGWAAASEVNEAALIIPRHALVADVEAPPDERVLRFELQGRARANATHTIVLELLGSQRNALALDQHDRVVKQLGSRGSTRQQRGQAYQPPPPRSRRGIDGPLPLPEWLALLEHVPTEARIGALIREVAYISPLNAASILAGPDLSAAYDRYQELVTSASAPFVVPVDGERQPYPHHLWQPNAEPRDSLLSAIEAVASTPGSTTSVISHLERAVERARKKLEKLKAELGTAKGDADALRAAADLLLAHVHEVKRGSQAIELLGFDGQPQRLELDPALTAAQQAQEWYAQARKRVRAADRLPQIIEEAESELDGANQQLERARAGETVEVEATKAPRKQHAAPTEKLPYRKYRTSSGLEVRVGRSSRGNDELTLRHCTGNDIWMHARAVGGAHVVLRWTDADNTPPRSDLIQAATLAALHSKARHSGMVPVDWTRRKHVRKRRGSPAGQVMVERAKTVFVEPSAEMEELLRWRD